MRVDLHLHGRPVESVFELLGTNENDVTYSIGWALAQSPAFLVALTRSLFPTERDLRVDRIELQQRSEESGITDIELHGPRLHVIIEAKRGWQVPTRDQLSKYAARFRPTKAEHRALVSMSECTPEYASTRLVRSIEGMPVVHLGWREVARLATVSRGSHAEKRLLAQLRTYFQRIVKMQNQGSNLVFVVSLGSKRPPWSKLSWIDIVNQRGRYFHRLGDGWPKEPVNYLGFRYGGQLRSIRHVDSWKIITDITAEMPELTPPNAWKEHILYTLGPAIVPPKVVKTGKVYPSGRVWAALDLLLTCDTVSEARDRTVMRRENA